MKTILALVAATVLAGASLASAQTAPTYTNFIRQTQFPTGVVYDAPVSVSGSQLSPLPIDPGGARFELWTVKSSPLTSYLLDTKYVGTYIPLAWSFVITEDPYDTIPRTRADRPFWVYIYVSGLLNGATDPDPAKSVKLLRHVQSYGAGGDGTNINRNLATLYSQSSITTNGWVTMTYNLSSVPGADRSKIRGEERFSVYSLADYQAPESQLASQFVQIWPVADGTITGITSGQLIKGSLPDISLTLNDLYPDSRTYAQVYKGNPQLGKTGDIVPGSALIVQDTVPQSRTLSITNYDSVLTEDGRWTMEVLTSTPFGTDRLAYISFDLDRTIKVNGSVSTIE